MRSGSVKFYDDKKGFGFITPSDGGKDVFFHFSVVDRKHKLTDGDAVEFTSEQGDRGEKAVRVVPVG